MPNHAPPPKSPCAHKKYELTCDDYDRLVDHAGSACQICGALPEGTGHGFLVVDHDAKVGPWAVRGLLCSDCNTALPCGASPSWARRYLADPWWRRERLDEVKVMRLVEAEEAERLLVAVAAASEAYITARKELEAALLDALRAPGAQPTKIAEASPWTAVYVRKFARENGVEPPERYRKRSAG